MKGSRLISRLFRDDCGRQVEQLDAEVRILRQVVRLAQELVRTSPQPSDCEGSRPYREFITRAQDVMAYTDHVSLKQEEEQQSS